MGRLGAPATAQGLGPRQLSSKQDPWAALALAGQHPQSEHPALLLFFEETNELLKVLMGPAGYSRASKLVPVVVVHIHARCPY